MLGVTGKEADHEQRILDFLRLQTRPLATKFISEQLGISRNTVAKHLLVLSLQDKIQCAQAGPAKVWYTEPKSPESALQDLVVVGGRISEIGRKSVRANELETTDLRYLLDSVSEMQKFLTQLKELTNKIDQLSKVTPGTPDTKRRKNSMS